MSLDLISKYFLQKLNKLVVLVIQHIKDINKEIAKAYTYPASRAYWPLTSTAIVLAWKKIIN